MNRFVLVELSWGATALLCLMSGCGKEPETRAPRASQPAPQEWFEEITERAGLKFIHHTGTNYFMPDQIGSGGALFDYDGDGRLDVYLVQNAASGGRWTNRLFHQEADGRFKDVSAGSGLDVAGYGMGVAVGDVNNDGRPDVLLTEYRGVRLFLNAGSGKFIGAMEASGLDNPRWATSAAFVDYDRDGWLDLVVANYLDFDPTQKCFDSRGAPEFCGPEQFQGLVTRLFHNLGLAGTDPRYTNASMAIPDLPRPVRFEDVTVPSGLARAPGPGLGILCADFDGDTWPDIFLADDGKPNRLFINQRNGTFKEQAAVRGLAFNAMGQTAANMGVAIGDVDGDGAFDIFVTHLTRELHALWVQGPRGFFQDRLATAGLARQGWRGTGFGAALLDLDNDGDLDLAFVNGLVKREGGQQPVFSGVDPFWIPYAQRNQLFANDGKGNFSDVSMQNPAFCGQAAVGRSLICGDVDNDGRVDLLVTSAGGQARLFRNVSPRDSGHHWLLIRAIEPALGGREACGAEIVVQAKGRRWWRLLNPGYGYLCSNDSRAHFGLGETTMADSIQVLWPDGTQEEFPGGPVDRIVTLRKGTGRLQEARRAGLSAQ